MASLLNQSLLSFQHNNLAVLSNPNLPPKVLSSSSNHEEITGVGDHKHNDKSQETLMFLTWRTVFSTETKERRAGWAGEEEGTVYSAKIPKLDFQCYPSAKVKRPQKILNNLYLWVFQFTLSEIMEANKERRQKPMRKMNLYFRTRQKENYQLSGILCYLK